MYMDKRGQEGVTLTTLLLIILGVVVVVVVILFFTGTFDRLGEARDVIPGNLAAAAQACKISAQAGSVTDFCYNFRKLSDEQYSNCQDPRIEEELKASNTDYDTIQCDDGLKETEKAKICESVDYDGDVYFNNDDANTCAAYSQMIGPPSPN